MKYRLEILSLGITNCCNLKCIHCTANSGKPLENELTANEIGKLISDCKKLGLKEICITGGEPLLRKDLFDILRLLRKNNIYIELLSNGTLITERIAVELKKYVNLVQISIDGASKKLHDSFRGVKGSFKKAINGLGHLKNAGVKTRLSITVARHNFDDILRVIDLAKKLEVDSVTMRRCVPCGRARLNQDLFISKDQYRKLFFDWVIKTEGIGIDNHPRDPLIILADPVLLDNIQKEFGNEIENEVLGGCVIGLLSMSILPNGDVIPCHGLPLVLGNIRKEPIINIWKNSAILNELRTRKHFKGKCNFCPYKNICGGCRAEAYWQKNDYLEEDPRCWFGNIKIRKAVNSDLKIIAQMNKLASFPLNTISSLKKIGKNKFDINRVLLLEKENEPIGKIEWTIENSYEGRMAIIRRLFINENERGKGYGSMLVQAAESEIKKEKVKYCDWAVFPENKASINLAKKFGYNLKHTEMHFIKYL